jgi:hypothetical protein
LARGPVVLIDQGVCGACGVGAGDPADQAIDQAFRAVAELAGLKVIDEWRDGS